MKQVIEQRFAESGKIIELAGDKLAHKLQQAAEIIIQAYKNGGGVFLFGNGGSAADAQHIAGELAGRFLKERRALKAEALSSNTSVLTALGNDYSFDVIFARQLEANARRGDVAVGLSTSGNSSNVIEALKKAKQLGMKTIAFTGEGGGKCAEFSDVLLDVPTKFTPHVQQVHVVLYHILCELIENAITA